MRGWDRRGLVAGGLVALSGAALLTACGGGPGPAPAARVRTAEIAPGLTPAASTTPDGAPTASWVRRLCVAFSGYGQDVAALGGGFAASNTANATEMKDALVSYLDAAATRTQRFKTEVDALGAAPIGGGREFQAELTAATTDVVTIFDSALGDARALDTGDRPALAARASEISQRIETGFGAVGATFDAIDTKYDTGELSKAAATIPECATLFG